MTTQGTNVHKKPKAQSTTVVFMLCALFIGPLILAWYLYNKHDLLGEGTVNHGQLITPPFSIQQLPITADNGNSLSQQSWNGKWTLLYYNPGQCGTPCQNALAHLNQIQQAVGKNSNRIEKVVVSNASFTPKTEKILAATPHANILHYKVKLDDHASIKNLQLKAGDFYIIDPMGNVMMHYKKSIQRGYILTDLERLLKVSQIG